MRLPLLSPLALTLLAAAPALAGDVTVTLKGVQARGGVLYVSVQNAEQFGKPRAGFSERFPEPAAGTLVATFRDVPPGLYAMRAFHDEDGDGVMQRSLIGWPKEGWAMSNQGALRGPPHFKVVKFEVGADGAQIAEKMLYTPK